MVPPPPVECPRGGRLVLAWLVATLAAAIPCALAVFVGWSSAPVMVVPAVGLACSPLASAAALALCRRAEKTEPLTRDGVIGVFWLTGAGFAVVVPPMIGIALVVSLSTGTPGSGLPQGLGVMVLMFLLIWMMATVVGVAVATPISAFAGYVVSRTVFRLSLDLPEMEVVAASSEASRP